MENDYPFGWLDDFLEIRLNPSREGFSAPEEGALQEAMEHFRAELDLVLAGLKAQAFRMLLPEKVKQLVGVYLEAIAVLQKQARENLAAYPEDSVLSEKGERLLMGLDGLQRRIEKRYARCLPDTGSTAAPDEEGPLYKVLVRLSVDQVAIILKAADEVKLLISRSLSLVFRSIMPFLSTEKTRDISWKSARCSTYKMEEGDKQAAIRALEQLIGRIRGF